MQQNPSRTAFVLITMLLFLTVITLLCLQLLQNSLDETKMSANMYQSMRLFNIAESALFAAEEQVAASSITTKNLTRDDSAATWLKEGVPIDIENVTTRFSSQKIQSVCYKTQHDFKTMDFYRITVWVQDNSYPLLLQTCYTKNGVVPIKSEECISQQMPRVGRQSWRQLD